MADTVTVIIPTHDRNDLLLGRALPSVFRQTRRVNEILIVSDGDLDDWVADLDRRIEALRDPRIHFWRLPRQWYPENPNERWCLLGLNARNHGLDQALGDWIAPLDDDDAWTDDHVAVLLETAHSNDADFAYGRSIAHWADGGTTYYGAWPPGHFQFCDGAQIYRNGLGYRYDPRCLERGLPEDGDLWDRMVAGGVKFAFYPEIVHTYYPNPR